MISSTLSLLALFAIASAHSDHRQQAIAGPHQSLWYNTIPGDGGTQADSVFSGISTFGRLPYFPCLSSEAEKYDIAFIGEFLNLSIGSLVECSQSQGLPSILAPHTDLVQDSARVVSDKVLAVLISSSRKLGFSGGYNVPLEANPFVSELKVLDCGDIPVTSYDNAWAIRQIEEGHNSLLMRKPFTDADAEGLSRAGKTLPRVITLGGDHTITLPLLRSINKAYGPVTVIHFDSHLDTWKPKVFGGSPSQVAAINHGTYFYHAAMEGLLKNDTNIHAGIRTTLSGPSDYENDGYCGFEIVEAREIDTIGPQQVTGPFEQYADMPAGTDGIIKKIRDRVGTDNPVYLSIDIDTLDPASVAPATGTPETGGWSTRELRTIIRGLDGLNFIGADIVEVAPAYDTNAELSTMAAADVLYEVLTIMVKKGPLSISKGHEL
ncbi:LOW QUALITY PROTEIN: putative agmatinase 1 [Aspergillus udagawae]|uniref:Putative agmatinase 1 n=1 Tax=Aspergillus udagawae TaxID=91492 RepID=A0A8H3N7F5_9EURO|nr:LOW QUALITY PROTEIN: putative agmatinase 1 [Aspergillus udagawae]